MLFNPPLFDFIPVNDTFSSPLWVTPQVQEAENIALSAYMDEPS
jgi:hypothetical protein